MPVVITKNQLLAALDAELQRWEGKCDLTMKRATDPELQANQRPVLTAQYHDRLTAYNSIAHIEELAQKLPDQGGGNGTARDAGGQGG